MLEQSGYMKACKAGLHAGNAPAEVDRSMRMLFLRGAALARTPMTPMLRAITGLNAFSLEPQSREQQRGRVE